MTFRIYNLTLNKGLKSEIQTRLTIKQDFDIDGIENDSFWECYAGEWERKSLSYSGITNQHYLGDLKLDRVSACLFYYQADDLPALAVVFDKFVHGRQFSKNLNTLQRMLFGGKNKESTLSFKKHEFSLNKLVEWHWDNHRRSNITIGKVLVTPKLLADFQQSLLRTEQQIEIPPEIARGMFYTGEDDAFAFG
ncbi:hypothetical protein [Pseudomonas asiatica]|uniref:hypothetical protein n=1 Tax=Pseudomonas asiatica TaxID=2219225 RepID=UPI0025A4A944|nr:hypothetical protein [Pseudomonas asiatica]WJN51856.1 hypothetical protein QUR91_08660 [Pseudomonas asiatica]